MGIIGFLFQIENTENIENKSVFFNNKNKNNKHIATFIEFEKAEGTIIIGKDKFQKNSCEFIYLNKDRKIKPFIILKDSPIKTAKIRTSQNKMVDFEFLTFWFPPKEYKELYELMTIKASPKSIENELKTRIKQIINYFL